MAKASDVTALIDRYVETHIPIYVIHLPTNQLMGRQAVKANVKEALDETTMANFLQLGKSEMKADVMDWFVKSTRYAIFSHRWSDDEPSFETMRDEKVNYQSSGGRKLAQFCSKAWEYGCEFAWSDTCCIDKASSAELQESLNSMFDWYRNAHVCIAYLGETTSMNDMKEDVWFKRGWTLQELLAPENMRFYNRNWQPLNPNARSDRFGDIIVDNDKADKHFLGLLSNATNIAVKELEQFNPGTYRVREMLNWASNRTTTRIEDMAYSLMGIFGVQLGVMYGEGRWAFYRLQEEVMKECDEMGLFVWDVDRDEGIGGSYNSMIASDVTCFKSPVPFSAKDTVPFRPLVQSRVTTDRELNI